MSSWVRPLAMSWDDLRARTNTSWLWLDLEDDGAHQKDTLPAAPTPGVTHLWGWGGGEFLRVRVDASLPGGLAGAVLADDGPGTPVTVTTVAAEQWAVGDHRVGLVDGLRRGQARPFVVRTARYVVGAEARTLDFVGIAP